jgi:hypothetical protein
MLKTLGAMVARYKDALEVTLDKERAIIAYMSHDQLKDFWRRAVAGTGVITWDYLNKIRLYGKGFMPDHVYKNKVITATMWQEFPQATKDKIFKNISVSVSVRNTVVKKRFKDLNESDTKKVFDKHRPSLGILTPAQQENKSPPPPNYASAVRMVWHPTDRNFRVIEGVQKRTRVCISISNKLWKEWIKSEPEEPNGDGE